MSSRASDSRPSDSRPSEVRLDVPADAAGERLDRWLAGALDEPRNQVQGWLEDGHVRLDGRSSPKASRRLAGGETVEVTIPAPEPETLEPEDEPVPVVVSDPAFLVLDKPAGLTVHPGAGRSSGTLAHRLLAHWPELAGVGGPGRPGIVHRLDKDTSGLMVVARTREAYRHLSAAFAERSVDKRYLAIVYGTPPAAGTIDRPVGRNPKRRKEMTVRPDGRPAVSHWRLLGSAPEASEPGDPAALAAGVSSGHGGVDEAVSALAVTIETGRTHQIRVHLKAIGHPIVGDPIYGEARWKGLPGTLRGPLAAFPRPALHAHRLAFDHPETGERVTFEAPPPADLEELWGRLSGGREFPLPGKNG